MNRTQEEKIQRIEKHLFADGDVGFSLTPAEEEMKARYQAIFVMWCAKPWEAEGEIRAYIKSTFSRSDREARADIHAVKLLLGNVTVAKRTWHQHTAIEMALNTYRIAAANKDTVGMNAANRNYVTANRLHLDEPEDDPWKDIVPPDFDLVSDVRILGLPPIKDLKAKQTKYRQRFLGKEPEEVPFKLQPDEKG